MAGGRLGDIFGHKYVLLFGISLFNLATPGLRVFPMIGLGSLLGGRFKVCVHLPFNKRYGDWCVMLTPAWYESLRRSTIRSAQSLVALSFQDPKARVKEFGACGSSGFV